MKSKEGGSIKYKYAYLEDFIKGEGRVVFVYFRVYQMRYSEQNLIKLRKVQFKVIRNASCLELGLHLPRETEVSWDRGEETHGVQLRLELWQGFVVLVVGAVRLSECTGMRLNSRTYHAYNVSKK